MKRYTLIFQLLNPSVSPDEVRNEVEQVLLFLHPRITYKMGQAIAGADGRILAQITVDGKRELLEAALKAREWKLPVRFESMRWGWLVENEDATLLVAATSSIEVDPLVGVEPFEGVDEFPVSKLHLRRRYITLMVSTLVMILIFIANAIQPHSTLLEGIYLVCFGIFLFSLNDTPIDFRVYAEKIGIRQQKLELSYWMLKEPVSLEWEKIWGLDYVDPVCMVYSAGGKTRFLLSERFGCKEKSIVMKTVVKRANLNFVEGNFRKLMYRRYDA
jgi:hypothetical protein